MQTAILVDRGFFKKRYQHCYGANTHDPKTVVKNLYDTAIHHVESNECLYRFFYYDCPPFKNKAHNPITKRPVDFGKTSVVSFNQELFEELKRRRKIALRLGDLRDHGGWKISPERLKALLAREISIDDLTERDVSYDLVQKGVDMRIGLDIASLSYKRLVGKIVLVSGDSDFVPAAKLARREGIDFVLDSMWSPVSPELHEHIDGLYSVWAKPPLVSPKLQTKTVTP